MKKENKYQETKEQCQAKIGILVCEGCGGKLEPLETVNNANEPTFWVGCQHCSCFRGGVLKQYWKIARGLVESGEIVPYRHLFRGDYENTPEKLDFWLDSQTAGLSRQVGRIHKLLEKEFNPPITSEALN